MSYLIKFTLAAIFKPAGTFYRQHHTLIDLWGKARRQKILMAIYPQLSN
jgi:hypothetical protein